MHPKMTQECNANDRSPSLLNLCHGPTALLRMHVAKMQSACVKLSPVTSKHNLPGMSCVCVVLCCVVLCFIALHFPSDDVVCVKTPAVPTKCSDQNCYCYFHTLLINVTTVFLVPGGFFLSKVCC